MLFLNFAQFTVCCDKYEHVRDVVVYSTQVYSTWFSYSKLQSVTSYTQVNVLTLNKYMIIVHILFSNVM